MVEKFGECFPIGSSGLERNIGNVVRAYFHNKYDDRFPPWHEGILQRDNKGFYLVSSRPIRLTDDIRIMVYHKSNLERLYDVVLK